MLPHEIYLILVKVAAASVLIPISFCLLKRKALTTLTRALLLYLIICFLADIIGIALAEATVKNDFVINTFTVLETGMFICIYYLEFRQYLQKSHLIMLFIPFCMVFLAAVVWKFVIQKGINETDNLVNTIETLILLIFSGIYFIHLALRSSYQRLKFFFWFNAGVFIYFCASFILFLKSKYFETGSPLIADILWGINLFVYILKNSFFTIGIAKENG